MRNSDVALYETGMQFQSQRMELYQANQLTDQTRRDEVEMKNRAFQENRARSCQEIEELQRICCAEADRARQLRINELSTKKEERKSTVNQLMLQIQELQDKMNSRNDAEEFYDPETASSSGFSHVPSQPMSILGPIGMIRRDSCLQLATRNSLGTTGKGFCRSTPDEQSSAIFENSKNLASASCRSMPLDTSKTAERGQVLGKETQNCAIPAPHFILSTDPKPLDVVQFSMQNLSHFGWVQLDSGLSSKIRFWFSTVSKTSCSSLESVVVPQRHPRYGPHGAAMCSGS